MKRNQRVSHLDRTRRRLRLLAVILVCGSVPATAVAAETPLSRNDQASQTSSDTPMAKGFRRLPPVRTSARSTTPAQPTASTPAESGVAPDDRDGSVRPSGRAKLTVSPVKPHVPDVGRVHANPYTHVNSRSSIPNAVTAAASSRHGTPVEAVAHRGPATMRPTAPHDSAMGDPWLQSVTEDTCIKRAAELLDDAYREYSVAAWASAEDSAWRALQMIATGIDVSLREAKNPPSALPAGWASGHVTEARTAIREARDFAAAGQVIDPRQIRAIVVSHQTPVFSEQTLADVTAAAAVDAYLDYARGQLVPLAIRRVQAAQAMDLIAAVQLGRNDSKTLAVETALCLRRAALQGQPGNASLASRLGMQLADMGLDEEATRTLQHAMKLSASPEVAKALADVTQRSRNTELAAGTASAGASATPSQQRATEVFELSPSEFASISPAVNAGVHAAGGAPAQTADTSTPVDVNRGEENSDEPGGSTRAWFASFRKPTPKTEHSEVASPSATDTSSETPEATEPSGIKRFFNRIRNW
ncbi:hypothetical protein FYK55_01910 [Roseiconus nitratireducens]|uniref:Uncharacterized protein n=1 Tax=Roseiconus nitratireducens TaxID=2605748 RepID=A0A5M6DP19_9BACT|nr:hypothetical protein [Roseiconus nitratireducens]KAA5547185.1 hypothetical protein FYK55_01910 [Roseiconus nitratireducens]